VGSITLNAYLVAKVRFPREILPLASVGAALVHLVMQSAVIVALLVVIWHPVDWTYVWLVIPVSITFIILAAALAIMLGALNVYARDTGHLLELVLLAWFYTTPILYPYQLVSNKLVEHDILHWLPLLNPIADLMIALQRGVYGSGAVHHTGTVGSSQTALLPDASVWWYFGNVGIVFAISVGLFILAIKVFDRAEGNFAEVM
jgi:ABC-2 type transport system permease protein